MKIKLLAFVFTFFSFLTSNAQSSFRIFDAANNDITNTTLQIWGDTSTTYAGNFKVKNSATGSISSKFRKEEIAMAPGSSSSICYAGNCFASGVYISPCKTDISGATEIATCDFTFGNTYAPSTVRYTIYNCSNGNDSASFLIHYNSSPAGIQVLSQGIFFSDPFPNPTSGILNIPYQEAGLPLNSQILIHDVLGNLVKSVDVSESAGNIRLDVSDLRCGMYFYTLHLNGNAIAIKKFIVKK
jgi:hypothetical protein